MQQYTVLLDANVLYPAPMRDILMELSQSSLFNARWTAEIHEEWIRSLLKNEPQRNREDLERTRELMDQHADDCLVTDYQQLTPSLDLPDKNDRHVLAAAIVGRCNAIITQNLKDFPAESLRPYGIETQHPDQFIYNQLTMAPGLVCSSLKRIRKRLKNPPYSTDEYLNTLTQQGLITTVAELGQFIELI